MAHTEFYAQLGGSNLNAGSTTNNTAAYTSIHGNYVQATGVFTPTDGSTPASTVNVGDWASVYVDGASVTTSIARISVVVAGVNGAITANTAIWGSKPANQTGTATIKVGGAWQGPNAASGFPFSTQNVGSLQNTSSQLTRVNLKNDQTYSLTAAFSASTTGGRYVVQGYTSTVGDGGRATFDGGTSTSALVSQAGPVGMLWQDLIFTTSISSGTGTLFTAGSQSLTVIRCVFANSRGLGLNFNGTAGATAIECEFYNCNRNNSVSLGGVSINSASTLLRCISHDNTGSNTSGIVAQAGDVRIANCISDTNGANGVTVLSGSTGGTILIQNCDIYNNTGDAINIASNNAAGLWAENCNFIKNTGAGINNASTTQWGSVYNCGYGAGTQANGSADTINNLIQTGSVTYGSNLTPWVDPANGDFRVNLAAACATGRGAFTQTASSYAGSVGYPDIGAVQSKTGAGGTFSKEVSYGSAS